MKSDFHSFFQIVRPDVDSVLDRLLPPASTPPSEIHRAMRYSVFAGGKRLRPALCVAGYTIAHSDYTEVLPVAAALEMAHTYSLIHDDLPAMDDDDFRRGIPSCHKEFGEALAVLAGDALLTLAFETIAQASAFPADGILHVIHDLASALGTRDGMISGQVLDLIAEGRSLDTAGVEAIHTAKTARLLAASVTTGAYLAGLSAEELERVHGYGGKIGLAFQIVDDILDETQSREVLGKTAGKDRERRKATYPAALGVDGSRRIVARLTEEARQEILPLGSRGDLLVSISQFLETRGS